MEFTNDPILAARKSIARPLTAGPRSATGSQKTNKERTLTEPTSYTRKKKPAVEEYFTACVSPPALIPSTPVETEKTQQAQVDMVVEVVPKAKPQKVSKPPKRPAKTDDVMEQVERMKQDLMLLVCKAEQNGHIQIVTKAPSEVFEWVGEFLENDPAQVMEGEAKVFDVGILEESMPIEGACIVDAVVLEACVVEEGECIGDDCIEAVVLDEVVIPDPMCGKKVIARKGPSENERRADMQKAQESLMELVRAAERGGHIRMMKGGECVDSCLRSTSRRSSAVANATRRMCNGRRNACVWAPMLQTSS